LLWCVLVAGHTDAPSGIAVEVASHDPEQRDSPWIAAGIVVLVERIEVVIAIRIGVESRRGVEGEEQ
jgi:hypothetical protein